MENSKQFLKDNKIVPFISFKDKKAHSVELVKDKIDKIFDKETKTERDGVKYMVKENGELRTFFTTSIGLIQKLADYSEGSVVKIQMKSKADGKGGWISYYEVNGENDDLDDIPVIEEPPIEEYDGK